MLGKLDAFTAKRTQVVVVDTDPAAHVEIVQQFGDRVWAVLDECDALLAEHMPGKRPCTRSASGNRDAVLRIDTSVSPQCDADPDDVERGRMALFGERDAYMRLMSVPPQAPPGEVELWRQGLQDGAFAERVCVVLQDAACAEHMPADTAHPLARHLRHMLAGIGSRLRMDEALKPDALGDDRSETDDVSDMEHIKSFLEEQGRYTEELLEEIGRRGNTQRALGALLRENNRYVETTQQHAEAWRGRLQDHPHFVDRAGAGGVLTCLEGRHERASDVSAMVAQLVDGVERDLSSEETLVDAGHEFQKRGLQKQIEALRAGQSRASAFTPPPAHEHGDLLSGFERLLVGDVAMEEARELDAVMREAGGPLVNGEVVVSGSGPSRDERAANRAARSDADAAPAVAESRPLVLPTPTDELAMVSGEASLGAWAEAAEETLKGSGFGAQTNAREGGEHTPPLAVDFGWHATRGADRNCDVNGVAYSCVTDGRIHAGMHPRTRVTEPCALSPQVRRWDCLPAEARVL